MPSDTQRLKAIVATAVPTARSPGALKVETQLSVYPDGHVSLAATSDKSHPLNLNNREEWVAYAGQLYDLIMERQKQPA